MSQSEKEWEQRIRQNAQKTQSSKPSSDDVFYSYFLAAKAYIMSNDTAGEAWAWVGGTVAVAAVLFYIIGWWTILILILVPIVYYLYNRYKPQQQTLIAFLRKNLTEGKIDRATALTYIKKVHQEVKRVQTDITQGLKSMEDNDEPEFMRIEKSKPFFESANKAIARALNSQSGHVTQALSEVADLYVTIGDFENAEPLMRQVAMMLKRLNGDESEEHVKYLYRFARTAEECGKVDAAEAILNEVSEVVKGQAGEGTPDHAMTLNNIAAMLQRNDKHKKAATYRAQATKIMEGSVGKDHPLYLQSLSQAASQHEQAEEFEKATVKFQQVLEALKEHEDKASGNGEALPPGFLHMKAVSMLNLAHCYCSMNKSKKLKLKGTSKFEMAKDLCQQSVEVMEGLTATERGEEYISVLRTMADIHFNLKEWSECETLFEQVLALLVASKGENSMHYAFTMGDKAVVLKEQKKVDESAAAFRAAANAVEKAQKGKGNMHFVSFTTHEGLVLQENERFEEALACFDLAHKTVAKTFGEMHPDTALACQKLAKCHQDMKQFSKAEPLFRMAVEILAKTNIPGLLLPAFQQMGECFEAAGQKDQAKQMFEHMRQLQMQLQMAQNQQAGRGRGSPGMMQPKAPIKRAFGQNKKQPQQTSAKKGGKKKK